MSELFTTKAPTDPRPQQHGESAYQFLNRIHQPFWERQRHLLDAWFARYAGEQEDGTEAKRRFLGTFQSHDDRQHEAACWELYLHELFLRLGFEVVVEPVVDGKTPDFLVGKEGEPIAFIEAAVDFPADSDGASDRRLQDFMVSVESTATIQDTALSFQVRRRGDRPLAGARVGEQLLAEYQKSGAASLTVASDGWAIDIDLVSAPGYSGRFAVGEVAFGGTYAEVKIDPVRNRLKKKGDKYKNLGLPLLVAINVLGQPSPITPQDVAQAMYGSVVSYFGHDGQPLFNRASRDGILGRNGSGQRTNVSGLIFAQGFSVVDTAKRTPAVYLNRLASLPISAELLKLETIHVDDPTTEPIQAAPAPDAASLFGLPADWPGPEVPFSNPY